MGVPFFVGGVVFVPFLGSSNQSYGLAVPPSVSRVFCFNFLISNFFLQILPKNLPKKLVLI